MGYIHGMDVNVPNAEKFVMNITIGQMIVSIAVLVVKLDTNNTTVGVKIVRNVQYVVKPERINMIGQKIVRNIQNAVKPGTNFILG
ncbi:MAG TPA: hypothetical protein VIK55_18875 [Paludibacter sp.]